MKYIKYFENSEDGRSEIWEIDDQFPDLMDNDDYVVLVLEKIGMDDRNINNIMNQKIPNIRENFRKAKEQNRKLYLYFKKVYDIDYVQGYQYIPILRNKPWWEIPDDCEFKNRIKVEDWELKERKYNL